MRVVLDDPAADVFADPRGEATVGLLYLLVYGQRVGMRVAVAVRDLAGLPDELAAGLERYGVVWHLTGTGIGTSIGAWLKAGGATEDGDRR
jgi:hypothetical protein